MTETLAWSLSTDNGVGSSAAWGCRTIWNNDFIDFMPERSSVFGDTDSKQKLLAKVNRVVMPWSQLNDFLRNLDHDISSTDIVTVYEDDEFVLRCSAQGSYGYLYMTARLK